MEDTRGLVEAKNFYQENLIDEMTPHVIRVFGNMWRAAERDKRQVVRTFQAALMQVPKWNAQQIEDKTNEVLLKSPLLQNKLSAVFLSIVKVLSQVRLPGSRTDIRVPVPAKTTFVHMVYWVAAHEFYELLREGRPVFGTGRSRVQKDVARTAVLTALQRLMPMKELLDAYISNEVASDGTVSPEPFPGATAALPPESLGPSRFEPDAEADAAGLEGDLGERQREGEGEGERNREWERGGSREREGSRERDREPGADFRDPDEDSLVPEEPKESEKENWMDDGRSQREEPDEGEERRIQFSPRRKRPIMSGDAGDSDELAD